MDFSDSETTLCNVYTSLYICPNSQEVHHQEWTQGQAIVSGDCDVSVLGHQL